MEYAIDWETRVKTILTAERMERSAVLMDVKTTVLNLVIYSAQKSVILMLSVLSLWLVAENVCATQDSREMA